VKRKTPSAATKLLNSVRPNILDRAIGFVSPSTAVRRLQARKAYALMGGGSYTGASKSRRASQGMRSFGGGPEADLNSDLPALRARSRELYRNTPIARGAVNEKVAVCVGAGHIVDPQINRDFLGLSLDEAEEWEANAAQIFRTHANSENIHAGRTITFAEMEALTLTTVLLSGDMLIFDRFKQRRGAALSTCFQLIEGDRLQNEHGQADTDEISGGVKRDKDGEPTEYFILDKHPGEFRLSSGRNGKWYKAFTPDGQRRVRHLYFMRRPGQVRGEPFLAPVIEALKQLDRYSEAELWAAIVNSCFAVTSKTENGEGLDLPTLAGGSGETDKQEISITEPGMIVDLAQDEALDSFTPGRPSAQFDPFFRAIVSQMALALDTTEELLMRSFKASYSASRGAIEIAYRFAQGYEAWLVSKFCQPSYESVLAEAIAAGRLSAPGFFSDAFVRSAWLGATWTGPARISLNPKSESDADAADLEMGITDQYRLAAKRGLLLDNVLSNRAKAKRNEERLGLGRSAAQTTENRDEDQDEDPDEKPDDESGGDNTGEDKGDDK
jgi:lambda family phage portal protein